MSLLKKIQKDLRMLADSNRAASLQRFFKTGRGEYGYGDQFLGITVPRMRALAKSYYESLAFIDLRYLLASKFHEERLMALLILVLKYKKANLCQQQQIYNFYFANIAGINNWDLVDLSAPYIVGAHLFDKEKDFLHKLAKAENLWQRRIAIVAMLTILITIILAPVAATK